MCCGKSNGSHAVSPAGDLVLCFRLVCGCNATHTCFHSDCTHSVKFHVRKTAPPAANATVLSHNGSSRNEQVVVVVVKVARHSDFSHCCQLLLSTHNHRILCPFGCPFCSIVIVRFAKITLRERTASKVRKDCLRGRDYHRVRLVTANLRPPVLPLRPDRDCQYEENDQTRNIRPVLLFAYQHYSL